MASIQPIIRIEIDPTKPVQEICSVIGSVMPYHPGQEEAILRGITTALVNRLAEIKKGAEKVDAEPIREPDTVSENQG